ncbi:hypothetical protein ACFL50_06010 [Candidatus Latescibacterota bacterium]
MKISTMLKNINPECTVFEQVGEGIPKGLTNPKEIFITSLFTWDLDKVVESIKYYKRIFKKAKIKVGGIAATLHPQYIFNNTGIEPHIGLLPDAEHLPPDYSLSFQRKNKSSMTFTSRGCIRKCEFCTVPTLEPDYFIKEDWINDIYSELPTITFWDNNWLASPNFVKDCKKLKKLGKRVDFNQGLDARLYNEDKAKLISTFNLDPIRFAFDHISYEKHLINAIHIAKKYSTKEIRVYVLYNFNDSPEDFYYRINLLNKEKVLAFPMEYREPTEVKTKFPAPNWNTYILRALRLSLNFYYRKGMITEKRDSFKAIFGKNSEEFISKLYDIYEYDKSLKKRPRKRKNDEYL